MVENEFYKFADRFYLEGKIEKFKEKNAVIVTADGQRLLWPIKNLPEKAEAGSEIRVIISTSQSDQEEREKVAKEVLNEILNNEDAADPKQG